MAETNIVELDFDPVGRDPKNYIPDEEHTVGPKTDDKFRFFKPRLGPFFTHDVELYHRNEKGEWVKLVAGTHYTFGFKLTLGSRHLLQPIYTVVQLIDNSLSGTFKMSYHSVGSSVSTFIQKLKIEGAKALLEPKVYTLEDIVDAPPVFPPVDHDVLTDETFGWNKVVEAIMSLAYAIAGDPTIPHIHEMTDIKGLVEKLRTYTPLDNSHKTSIHNAQRVVNHTGTVSLTLPSFVNKGAVNGNIVMFSGDDVSLARFNGVVDSSTNGEIGADWEQGYFEMVNGELFDKVSFTYDGSGRPVIYLGDEQHFEDVTFVLTDVTYSSDYTSDRMEGYAFTKEPAAIGALIDVVFVGKYLTGIINASHQTAIHCATMIPKSERSLIIKLPKLEESGWVEISLMIANTDAVDVTVRGFTDVNNRTWEQLNAVAHGAIINEKIKGIFDDGVFGVVMDNNQTTDTLVVIKSVTYSTLPPDNRHSYTVSPSVMEINEDYVKIRRPELHTYSVIGNDEASVKAEPNSIVTVDKKDVLVELLSLPHYPPKNGDTVTIRNFCRQASIYPAIVAGEVDVEFKLDVCGGEVMYSFNEQSGKYELISGR